MHRVPPPIADTLSFPADRALLQPKFESYKLSLAARSTSTCTPLPTRFCTAPLGDSVRLSFAEVQARAKHNHLALGTEGDLLWVGTDGNVKAARVDPRTAVPSFYDVVNLPEASPSIPSDLARAYPVVAPLSRSLLVVSDGLENIHLVRVDPSTLRGDVEASFTFISSPTLANRPLQLHRAELSPKDPEAAFLLLSVTSKGSSTPSTSQDPIDTDQPKLGTAQSRLKVPSTTSFTYFSARLSLKGEGGGELEAEWMVKGDDLPAFIHFDVERGRYCIASSAPVTPMETVHTRTKLPQTVVAEEMTRFEGTDFAQLPSSSSSSPPVPRPPPFSWSQDTASLTVALPIPSSTPTSSIRITFSRLYLTLHIASPSTAVSSSTIPSSFNLPRISHKKWWGEIDPHTSVWTFDREAEGRDSNFGILTLHLEKQHAGTKWSDVFATSVRPDPEASDARFQELHDEWDYEEVAETVDPSELAKISEDMEKWTRGIMEGGGVSHSQEGLGHGVPTSLMGDEMDVEIDADTGRSIVVSWIEPPSTSGDQLRVVTPHPTLPYSLLSTPLPFIDRSSPSSRIEASVTIKHDVDGLLFALPSDTKPYQWRHASTFPALAFVLATKRDTKFVYHHLDRFALAFDAPASLTASSTSNSKAAQQSSEGGGNLFAYFAPVGNETKGKQMVLKVGTGASGQVVGVAGIKLDGEQVAIVALCERELVVLRLE
ncbi:hypothetical protein JCM11491_000924 [Sporobolomyces phaffii]